MIAARDKAPHNVRVIERWIHEWAQEVDHSTARLRNLVATTIAAAMLERARASDGGPLLVIKGGAGLQLRMGLQARTSKDLDAAARENLDIAEQEIRRGLQDPWHGCTGIITATEEVPVTWMATRPRRLTIKLFYLDRNFGTVPLEIATPEAESADDPEAVVPREKLEAIGLPTPDAVTCLPVRWQIAQKLHACTDPGTDGGGNERARDLVDLGLLAQLVADWTSVRRAAIRIFEVRGRHPWPPQVRAWPGWDALWDRLRANGETTLTLAEAVDVAAALVARIDAAEVAGPHS